MAIGRASANSDARQRVASFRTQIRVMMRPYWIASLGFSLISNLLLLVSPIYMMQIYDRVLVSGSLDTLIWLSVIAVFLLLIYAAAESGRRRVLNLAGARLEGDLTQRVFRKYEACGNQSAIDADLGKVRAVAQLYSGSILSPLFDLPFVPLFVTVLFLVHPLLGWVGLAGTMVVLTVAIAAEVTTRAPSENAGEVRTQAVLLTSSMQRQRAAVIAMGMGAALRARHQAITDEAEMLALKTANAEGTFSGMTKSFRQILQMAMLGLGAALALSQQISAGTIVAGSIVLARALAPVDQIVGSWRSLNRGREAWRALKSELLDSPPVLADYTPLPRPSLNLQIDRLAAAPPASDKPLIHPFSLKIEGGVLITLVGSIGSGKTTLLQTLGGALPPRAGSVMLGASDVHAWSNRDRGRYVGYVPQHSEMFPGSVKQNIARFNAVHDREVFEALHAAGATELALSLPNGLDTFVGPGGASLSSGQLQLIGLARALLSSPAFLLLDEPTANLDPASAARFIENLKTISSRGCIVIAATHDSRLLQTSDGVLSINQGSISRMTAPEFFAQQHSTPLRIASPSSERKA
jgi:PrtD family type I secretion system ABC transporter